MLPHFDINQNITKILTMKKNIFFIEFGKAYNLTKY